MDDIILTEDHEEEIGKLKSLFAHEFKMNDLGNLKSFLGMEITRSKMSIAVSQRKNVLDLLKETRMLGYKPTNTPMDYTTKLGIVKGSAPMDKGRYQRLVRKLIYLSHTRPDIAFSVDVINPFMNNPTEEHMKVLYHILKISQNDSRKGALFQKNTEEKHQNFFRYKLGWLYN